MMEPRKRLSVGNYKNTDGTFQNPETLSKEDQIDFHLAFLMKGVIEALEMAVPFTENDRQFNRARYDIMAKFHATASKINGS